MIFRLRARMTADTPRFAAVFLPIAGGYLVSYIFRSVNGTLADELIRQFSLDAGGLGLLTSIYFLAFAISAIPIGMALDTYGPRHVQTYLMTVAALGSVVFALASNEVWLIIGRGLIGVGVAGALMAGLKANALWVSPRYLPFANGGIVMFGGLGAIVATLPVGALDADVGWRVTFLLLAALSLALAVAAYIFLPKRPMDRVPLQHRGARGFIDAVTDKRFIRLAPLSASVIGGAFAIQGLWAARWLVDVDGFQPDTVLDELLVMGIGLTIGSLVIGGTTTWLCRLGVAETTVFALFCIAFVGVQLALLMNIPLPAAVIWGMLGAFGGMSVLSYSILDSIFPTDMVGRTNSVLNLLHLAGAWLIQASMGLIIGEWSANSGGHYPLLAYRVAFAVPIVLQIIGLIWFARPFRGARAKHILGNAAIPPAEAA